MKKFLYFIQSQRNKKTNSGKYHRARANWTTDQTSAEAGLYVLWSKKKLFTHYAPVFRISDSLSYKNWLSVGFPSAGKKFIVHCEWYLVSKSHKMKCHFLPTVRCDLGNENFGKESKIGRGHRVSWSCHQNCWWVLFHCSDYESWQRSAPVCQVPIEAL